MASAVEQKTLGFAETLRATSILAAETDVSHMVAPPLARALTQALALTQASAKLNPRWADHALSGGRHVANRKPQTQGLRREESGHGSPGLNDLERLREKIAEPRVGHGSVGLGGGYTVPDVSGDAWAPVLAVYRAVDAVLAGGGRPRISFVRRGN